MADPDSGVGTSMAAPAAIEVSGCSKAYPGVQALSGVSLSVAAGEIRGLVGQNGAGKSTLIKVLAGAVRSDAGRVFVRGSEMAQDVASARRAGVSVIYQDPQVVPNLGACENVFLGDQVRNRLGLVNRRAMKKEFLALCAELDVRIRPTRTANTLSLGDRQLVEIMRAVRAAGSVLILDEPTSALPEHERDRLFRVIESVRRSGVAIIYISHDLGEVLELCDTVTVLRDGKHVHTGPAEPLTVDRLVEMMTGEAQTQTFHERCSEDPAKPPVAVVRGLCTRTGLRDVTLRVSRGEVVGLAGLLGSGRTEVLRAIAGADRPTSGALEIDGSMVPWPRSISKAKSRRIEMVPEDRRSVGLVGGQSVTFNIAMADFDRRHWWSWVSDRKDAAAQRSALERVQFPAHRWQESVRNLSGGNQQKVLFARLLMLDAQLVLLDEPTAGIDVGATAQIMKIVRTLANNGAGVLVVMSDLGELLSLCDRVYVMHRKRVATELEAARTTEDEVLQHAFGQIGLKDAS